MSANIILYTVNVLNFPEYWFTNGTLNIFFQFFIKNALLIKLLTTNLVLSTTLIVQFNEESEEIIVNTKIIYPAILKFVYLMI